MEDISPSAFCSKIFLPSFRADGGKTLWKRQRIRGLKVLSRAETHEKEGALL